MRKEDFLRTLSGAMGRMGCSGKHARRITQETSDHWDDLESEAREAGLDDVAASSFASERMGQPDVLVHEYRDRMRQSHWSGRHPIWTFVVLPPLLLGFWFLAWTSMALGAAEIYGKLLSLPVQVWHSYVLVLFWATVIHYTGTIAVPGLAWWWAQRSFCGRKWGWIACIACALHGLLNHLSVEPHILRWGYGWAAPDWVPVMVPLIVGTIANWYKQPSLSVALLFVALATGCASSKMPQERGWIGGEYEQAGALPGGVLITRLSTNTPAAHSGLREGDLIVRAAGEPVTEPRALFKAIDRATPGSRVPIEVWRDGTRAQREVVIGKESFKLDHSVTAGVLLAREWDLWPNPGFSLVALGYKRQESRLELDSAKSRLELSQHARDKGSSGLRSREGWEVWLPVCSFSSRKRILAQSAME